jgi:pseudouridine-5'-phosphate glycosidase
VAGRRAVGRAAAGPVVGSAAAGPGVAARLRLADEVAAALAAGQPVVALESTLISHGLPFPINLEVAARAEEAVRAAGATPATVAIRDGTIRVGLARDELVALASAPAGEVRKASRSSLAVALAQGGWAATTVSATMVAARAAGIAVFATGGIGGVHWGAFGGISTGGGAGSAIPARSRPPSLDVSADLEELARTPVAVVSAGPKAILDVAGTMEWLEGRGVPVLVVGQREVPGFWSRTSGVPAPISVADVAEAARVVGTHLDLGLGNGILVCVPVPEEAALPEAVGRAAVEQAVAEAEAAGVGGAELTPWLLARIAELTDGASLRANAALIVENARTAGELARRLAGERRGDGRRGAGTA